MLVLTRADVEQMLDLEELVGALARAHEELSSGASSMPPRIAAMAADGLLGAMPAYSPSAGLGCKLVTLFPHNTDRPTHQAEAVVRAEWVAPGTHVSSVGYNAPGSELDSALVREATIVVESRDSAFAPPPGGAPELAAVDPATVVELGELVSGARRGRTT